LDRVLVVHTIKYGQLPGFSTVFFSELTVVNPSYFLGNPILSTEQPTVHAKLPDDGGPPVKEVPDTTKLTAQVEAIASEIRKRQQETSKGMLLSNSPIQSLQSIALRTPSRNAPFPVGATSSNNERFMEVPEGIPRIEGWKVLEEGGISGIIYGSPSAEDGDYIETSPITSGIIEDRSVVETTSGSRYFLSPESADTAHSILNSLKGLATGRRGGTITIAKQGGGKQREQRNMQIAQAALNVLEKSLPRATFSLVDLFGGIDKDKAKKVRTSKPPTIALWDKAPPDGVPTLSNWTSNDDGTLTGFVFGSQSIEDGNLVTTSRIVKGVRKQYETVTTISGSLYFLS
jgi:hypothetical protein